MFSSVLAPLECSHLGFSEETESPLKFAKLIRTFCFGIWKVLYEIFLVMSLTFNSWAVSPAHEIIYSNFYTWQSRVTVVLIGKNEQKPSPKGRDAPTFCYGRTIKSVARWRVSRDLGFSSFSKGSKKTLLQYPAHIALIHFFNGYVCDCELATCVWAPGCGRVRVGWGEGVAGQGCSLGCKIWAKKLRVLINILSEINMLRTLGKRSVWVKETQFSKSKWTKKSMNFLAAFLREKDYLVHTATAWWQG